MNLVVRGLVGIVAFAVLAFSLYVLIAGAMFGAHWLWQCIGLAAFALGIALGRAAWSGSWPWGSG